MKIKSIRKKIFVYLFVFSILILAFLWFFQVIFLDTYYKSRKTREVESSVRNIIKKYDGTNLNTLLDDISYSKGICVEAVESNKNIYFSNSFNSVCRNIENDKYIKFAYISQDVEVGTYSNISTTNKVSNNTNISYGIRLDSNLYVFITESLIPMDSTINILSSQLVIVTIIVLLLSLVIAYFISNNISKPIIKINDKSKKMANGKYNIIFDSNTDIREIKELENTLSKTASELNKTEELRRELMANVSHDLKTPLTMIKAYSEMTRDLNINDKNKIKENLNIIIDETDRLNLLVNDILELSKIQSKTVSLNYENCDLVTIISNIVQKFKILEVNEKYKFIIKCNCDNAYVNCDKLKIEQVLYNLINNAINYTGNDNKVIISLEEVDNKYIVKISDTGNGIKEEDLKYIWDKYYKTDKKHKRKKVGTGIGLSIVKNILEMHEFKYGVNTSSKGSTFYFEIEKE